MPTFEFTSPDGKTHVVEGPEGATKEQAFAMLQQQLGSAQPAAPSTPPPAQPAAPPERSFLNQVGRSVGLAGRQFAQAANGTVGIVGDALNAGLNAVLPNRAPSLGDLVAGRDEPQPYLRSPSKIIQAGIDKIFPVPENTGEKVQDFVGTIAASGLRSGVDPLARAITSRFAPPVLGNAAEKLKTLSEAAPLGFKVTPSTVGSGLPSKAAEFVVGKGQLNANAAATNQAAYDALGKRVAGLPANTNLTHEVLDNVIKDTYETAYKPLEALGQMTTGVAYNKALDKVLTDFGGQSKSYINAGNPTQQELQTLVNKYRVLDYDSKDAVEATKFLRESAGEAFDNHNNLLAKANIAISNAIEDSIAKNLANANQPEILKNFQAGRKALAQQYTIRNAVVEGTGSIDPTKLRTGFNNGAPFTGELRTAAKFANTFPQISGINKGAGGGFNTQDKSVLGLGTPIAGAFGGLPAAAAVAAIPFAKAGGRSAILSGPGQALITPNGLDPNILARFARNKSVINALPTTAQQVGNLFGD